MTAEEITENDVRIATLGIRMESLEASYEKMEIKIGKAEHYTHVMLEDLIGRISKIEHSNGRFEENLLHVNGNGTSTNTKLTDIENRLRSIERLAWGALGGLGTVTAIFSFFGWQVLKLMLK